MKILLTLMGGLIGLGIAWAARPEQWGYRPTLEQIMEDPSLQSDFLIFGGIAALAGLGLGFIIDRLKPKK